MNWENLKDAQFRFITEEEYNDLTLKRDQLRILGENLDKCIELLYPNFDYGDWGNNITIWLKFLNQVQVDGVFHNFKWKREKKRGFLKNYGTDKNVFY